MNRNGIKNRYFQWLYDKVCSNRYHKDISYRKLLMQLHSIDFTYSIRKDENRAKDGESLRYRFARETTIDEPVDYILDCLDGPCSVLEMMIALAIRCEEDYMDDPAYGNRSAQWFWEMIANLNLGSMEDSRYNKHYVDDAIQKFLDRDYDYDGRGGLFRVRNSDVDMRDLEIWYQMCRFIDAVV